jgi:hypothetical protein
MASIPDHWLLVSPGFHRLRLASAHFRLVWILLSASWSNQSGQSQKHVTTDRQSASNKTNSEAWVRERTRPTERPPLVGVPTFADRGMSRLVSLGSNYSSGVHDHICITVRYLLVCWCEAHSERFPGPSPAEQMPIFYSLNFQTPGILRAMFPPPLSSVSVLQIQV